MRGAIDERGKKLFIGGLHLKTTEESLKGFYSQWGEIVDVVVMRDPQTGKSRGFGFVTYSDSSSVDEAQSNRPHEVDGIKVDSKRAMPKEDTSPEFHATVNRLFVGRLKRTVTSDDLRQYFGEYGNIADAVIINNSNGESRGFGFVTFEDTDSVDKIIVTRPHQLDGQNIEVKKALPREDNKTPSSNKPNPGNKSSSRPTGYSSNSSNVVSNRYSSSHQDDYNSYGNYPSATNNTSSGGGGGGGATGGYSNTNNRSYGAGGGGGGPTYNQGYSSQNYSNSSNSNKYSGNRLNESFNNDSSYNTNYTNESANYSNSYGQYDTPNQPPSSRYGYPPYSSGGGMGDYNQRQGGGPMRGAPRPNRGSGAGYGNYPY